MRTKTKSRNYQQEPLNALEAVIAITALQSVGEFMSFEIFYDCLLNKHNKYVMR